jgi:hypothetical protein
MTTFTKVERCVTETFDKLFGGMAALDRHQGTAFSIYLTFLLSGARNESVNAELWSAPHSPETLELLREKRCLVNKDRTLSDGKGGKIRFYRNEYFFDIVIFQLTDRRANIPDIICESEMDTKIDYLYKDGDEDINNGYIYDYTKLFFGRSNLKLLTCRASEKHRNRLEERFARWAKFYTKLWYDRKLIVVILPTVVNDAIRIGIGVKEKRTGRLEFDEMRLPRQADQ